MVVRRSGTPLRKNMETLFVKAARGKTTEKPVWMMRQAGRYLPEYRDLRNRFPDFLSFVKNPEAAAEATLQPVKRFDLDAAILFSDILVTLPCMGFNLKFVPGKGPVIENPVRSISDVQNLQDIDFEKSLDYTAKAIKLVRKNLSESKSLLGFVGGPLTIASYAIEGGSSKDLHRTKALFYNDPQTYKLFLERIARLTGEYLAFQAKCGADALVIMDSWAGLLAKSDYEQIASPYTETVISIVHKFTDVPIIHYANGASHLTESIMTLNANVFGVDHRSDLPALFRKYPDKVFQGNLDQAILFTNPAQIKFHTNRILECAKNRPHIMNLGHGILPETPLENVRAFIDAVHEF